MKPFLFNIKAVPNPDNPQAKDLSSAIAHVWVFDESINKAKEKAIRYINTYGWNLTRVEASLEMQPEQIAGLRKDELRSYKRSELYGISADFLAWPKEKRPGVYSVGPLKKPRKSKN